jgi:integrase
MVGAFLARCQLAIRGDETFPAEIADAPGVRRWLADCGRVRPVGSGEDVVEAYLGVLALEVRSRRWVANSRSFLRKLAAVGVAWEDWTPAMAREWVAAASGASVTSRNHHLQAAKRFFDWLVERRAVAANPFAGLRYRRSLARSAHVVYLDRDERARVLAWADGDRYWWAVWLAVMAGLRRGEAWTLDMRWVHLDRELIVIPEDAAKTFQARTIPMPTLLVQRLARERLPRGPMIRGAYDYEARARGVLRRMRRDLPDIDARVLSWNPFRHTFGSHLAQAGVGIDKIAAWLGDTVETARTHYLQFTPKDRKDPDIDLI